MEKPSEINHTHVHRDDEASKLGMWLFIFTELLLFTGLFIVYAVYRYMHAEAFALAADELSVKIGAINTVILLTSSMTVAMSTTALRLGDRRLALYLILFTLVAAVVFLVNKYFEWTGKFAHGLYPGSPILAERGHGEILFFGLYFFMTGLHALHIIVGFILLLVVFIGVKNKTITAENPVLLDNGGLYWHLVDLIWIFLFPLFYLIT
jgi:cytochrome c oxidase subunit 3